MSSLLSISSHFLFCRISFFNLYCLKGETWVTIGVISMSLSTGTYLFVHSTLGKYLSQAWELILMLLVIWILVKIFEGLWVDGWTNNWFLLGISKPHKSKYMHRKEFHFRRVRITCLETKFNSFCKLFQLKTFLTFVDILLEAKLEVTEYWLVSSSNNFFC